ncbi:hypothetical protein DPEC_G00135630 [Dallia pectoralis]|uniref:Uncharacterized protein n=1 Tax=Dallia pectoralis TaxID=75939 RepID=A0ACC2GLT7_DALPE|nr:hypothetical protein DPEC_G00135630 [Dallia pectoralis]
MDVSLTVTLMRGQMGTVIERAVSAAVETVLGEMLKVVSIKFDELKREVASKEKETESIRQMLDISRSQVKTMQKYIHTVGARQPPATAAHHNNQGTGFGTPDTRRAHSSATAAPDASQSSGLPQPQRRTVALPNNAMVTANGNVQPKSRVTVSLPSDLARASQPCENTVSVKNKSSPDSQDDLAAMMSKSFEDSSLTTTVSTISRTVEALEPLKEEHPVLEMTDGSQNRGGGEEQDMVQCETEWTVNVQQVEASPDGGSQPVLSPSRSDEADSFEAGDANPASQMEPRLLVKEEEAEVEIICIKQEPEEMESLLMNLAAEGLSSQGDLDRVMASQSQRDWPLQRERTQNHRPNAEHTAFSSAPCSYGFAQPVMTMTGHSSRSVVRPWPKDLSLYEEYRVRRADLRRRSQNRRREMEKTLPQPLLADLVKERREKTRLRVARWRAKRKLQACLLTQMTQTQHPEVGPGLGQGGNLSSGPGNPCQLSHLGGRPKAGPSMTQQRNSASNNVSSYSNSFLFNRTSCDSGTFPALQFNSSSLMLGQHGGHNVVDHSMQPGSSSSQQGLVLTGSELYRSISDTG